MLIIAGSLILDSDDRAAFLATNADVVAQARQAAGCLDFVQAADPLDPTRINVFERWDSEDQLLAFRGAGRTSDRVAADSIGERQAVRHLRCRTALTPRASVPYSIAIRSTCRDTVPAELALGDAVPDSGDHKAQPKGLVAKGPPDPKKPRCL